jgi:adenylate kinase
MFTADALIDTVQTGKKTFVNTFVQNENVKEALINFVDAQAEYTKKAAKVGQDTFTTLASESVKAFQNATKFDYAKFGEGVMKAYQTTTKK